ncbi:shikimate dehydrogenase family protein [Streptomyces fulvorobeus]|uniref:Shikimate dehydrogenase n=1 Tax=Streptomyces fulvorobeus TaxID=284028 RepID=A0A7J0CFU2_9ACTN|nr:shikimate dehydrogenase [Streptomyces fulvorobeus]NYE44090.1 shikimate dehydrogenase [Streptomyces fulvorobeus]GFN00597.1 shikimate dehydrogenase [Streptomyces fulvorobeus]
MTTEHQRITGRTRLFAVIGDPVEQVQAPTMMNPLFARLGIDAVLVPVHATPAGLASVVRGLQSSGNVDGLLVTVPHKRAALDLADEVSAAAALSDGTNAMRRTPDGRWLADNFDGEGFVRGLRSAGHEPEGRHVWLLGAGGAGSAIAVSLLSAGAEVTVTDRDEHRVHTLVERLSPHFPGRLHSAAGPVAADLAVNATPLGMRPEDPLPFEPALLPDSTVVVDIVMKPRRTALLRTAETRGLRVHYGAAMLAQQLDLYVDFFSLGRRLA